MRRLLLLGLILPVIGCGGKEYSAPKNLYPVKGTIKVGGQPLNGGLLSLVLMTDTDKYGPSEAPAVVKPDGSFEPVLFNGKPGLYPGRWKVVVKSTAIFKDGKKLIAKPSVPARYRNEDTSTLFIDVTEGENTPTLVLR